MTLELAADATLSGTPKATLLHAGDSQLHSQRLGWVAPRVLSTSFSLDGSDVQHLLVQVPGQPAIELPPVVLPYSQEFAPRVAGRSGSELLDALVQATGGGVYTRSKELSQRTLSASLPAGRPLLPLLAAGMLLLLLLDIAHRRGLLDAQLTRARGAVRRAARTLGALVPERLARSGDTLAGAQTASGAQDTDAAGAGTNDETPATDAEAAPAGGPDTPPKPPDEDPFALAKKRARRR